MVGFSASFGLFIALLITYRHEYPFFILTVFFTGLLPISLMSINDGYLKALEKFGYSALVEISGGLSKLAVLGLALLIMNTIEFSDVMMIFILASFLTFTVSSICILKVKTNIVSKAIRFKIATARALFNYSKWICLTDLMNTGILLTGNIILSYQKPKDLALFNVVILIYSIFQIGFGAITTVLIPYISRRSTKKEAIRLLGLREFILLALVTFALITGLLSFPWRQELLLVLFNKHEYLDAFGYLAILLTAFPFRLLAMTNKGIVQGIGQPKSIAYVSLLTLITHVLLFIPFYQLFALTGAMIAMVCAYLVEFFMTWITARKVLAQHFAHICC
jgi:O-antigen/teichoic acid export membrane protein